MSARQSFAQTTPTLKIGVPGDQSGHIAISAVRSQSPARDRRSRISAARFSVDVIAGDHQNKPNIGAGIARQWFDRDGVDVIVDVPHSGVALAVSKVARENNKILDGVWRRHIAS